MRRRLRFGRSFRIRVETIVHDSGHSISRTGLLRSSAWLISVLLCAGRVATAQTGGSGATATGVSRDLNPAISVNGLFLAAGFPDLPDSVSGTEGFDSGLLLQEAEVQFTAAIDPYTKADVVFSFEDGDFGIEEAIVSSDVLSHGIGLRAGQLFVPIGHENTLHTHQLPFIRRSLAGGAVFGEPLAEFGLEAAWLPALPWFLELRGGVYNGDDEELFGASGDWDLAYLGGVDALWDVHDGATFSIGADYVGGANGFGTSDASSWSHVAAGVLRYKWRSPSRPRERALELLVEYLYSLREAEDAAFEQLQRGGYADARVQWSRRWWVQGRYDYTLPPDIDLTQRGSFLVAFVPSEFSALRFQAAIVEQPDVTYGELALQLNFTIGSHPAHKY